MITITFPDNSIKQFDDFPTGMDVAKSISEGFARNCVAMKINGQLLDLSRPIEADTQIGFITANDDIALEVLRHSAAHVMAEAVLNLYPEAKLTIGPVVEDGFYYDIDMPPVSEDDLSRIETEIQKIIKAKNTFERQVVSKEKALEIFKDNPFKCELINELSDQEISLYQNGAFIDLCRGPHIPHTGMIKGIKLMKISGAYWRADPSREQLQRLYGTAFFDKKKLNQYLHLIEEAKKRDHRKVGTRLDLYSFHDEAPGMAFFHAKGMDMWNALLDYWRETHRAAGYVETKTPVILNRKLWEKSGHWDNYRENMYTCLIDDEEYAIKPMNCPGGMILFKTRSYSYRDLPLRAGEVGLVHRHELSGALSGLFRVRSFHQDDAHIFMTPDQIEQEVLGVLRLAEQIYQKFGLSFHLELSTRPEKSIGTDAQWGQATSGLEKALKTYGHDYVINEGDGAFYGPKIDIHIKDALSRTWQCGTVQLDMALPERFDLTYKGRDNEKHRPIMIHRVIYGSMERFFGILVEHFAGKFPLWLAPVQAVVLPITQDLADHADQVKKDLETAGIRCEVDNRNETLKKKVREAQVNYVPLILTIGEKEKETGTLSVRTLDGKVKMGLTLADFTAPVQRHISERILDDIVYNHDPGRADAKAFGDPTGFPPSPVLPLHRTLVSKVPATRIEVDLDSIAKNIQVLKQACGPQTSVMAVVKANAYGHGAVHVAQTALSHGAEWLGVARMAEALKLRDAEIKAPILVFGNTLPDQAAAAAGHGIRISLTGLDKARAVNAAAKKAGTVVLAHIKLDTGMGRLGLCPGLDMDQTLADIRSMIQLDHLKIEGIFTHFANADAVDQTHARQQLALFTRVLDHLDAANRLPIAIHAANSAATLTLPRTHFTLVRPGIALYGLCPGPGVDGSRLTPALSIVSEITQIKQVPKGFAVSYGSTHVTDRPTAIATVPVGYADGYPRRLSCRAHMLVKGQRAPVIGRVCMDFTMIDVGQIPDAAEGDPVMVLGSQGNETVSADELAGLAGTINYEITAGLTSRLPIFYRKGTAS